MTPLKFTAYQRYTNEPVTVIGERITHWRAISYNGCSGTCIVLDNGVEINVGHSTADVERLYKQAFPGGE